MSGGVPASTRPGSAGLLVVGGGVAGLRVAQSARTEGYDGPITLLGSEPHAPYDRPPLSKQVLTGELAVEATDYHPVDYFADLGIELALGVTAAGVDLHRQRLLLAGRDDLAYDALVVATGSRPRRLPFATPDDGIHVLRTRDDAVGLRAELLRSTRLAIVGAGFVGAEVASTAASLGVDVTIVETAATPLVRAVGVEVGRELVELHQTAGVKLVCQKAVTGFIGRGRVEGLTLDDGSILDVDLVLVGVGVVPDVEWLVGSGLELDDGLRCDAHLRTSDRAVFGAGDAVSWPSASVGARTRSQQWTTASDQGRHLGRVLVHGESAGTFDHDLYFWSDQYGTRVQGFGSPVGTTVVVDRDPTSRRYLAAFRDGSRVTGAVGINAPREFVALRKLARSGAPWSAVDEQFTTLTHPDGGIA